MDDLSTNVRFFVDISCLVNGLCKLLIIPYNYYNLVLFLDQNGKILVTL